MGAAGVGLICIILAMTLPRQLVPYSGFAFALPLKVKEGRHGLK
jgi:hypothetical protein